MSDPGLERAWHLNGSGRYAEAEICVRQVLATRPEDEWGLRLLSSTLSNQDRHDEALAAAQEACRVAPTHARAWMRLAHARMARHEPSEAVTAAENGVACAPTWAAAHSTLARACQTPAQRYWPHTAFDPVRALQAADEAVRLSPEVASYRNARAWALVLLKRWPEAESEYHRILAMQPNCSEALNGLGWRHRRWRPILACQYYTAALALRPQSEVMKVNLKGAIRSWIHRMIWIWVWGGLALGVVRGGLCRAGVNGPAWLDSSSPAG